MQSLRCVVPKGENSDGMMELHISAANYARFTERPPEEIEEELENAAEELRAQRLKAESESMKVHWPDALPKEVVVYNPVAEKKKRDDRHFNRVVELKKDIYEERMAYVNKVRHEMMLKEDFPRTITSALLFGEALQGREEQRQEKRAIRRAQIVADKEELKRKIEDAARYKLEEMEKEAKIREKDTEFANGFAARAKMLRDRELRMRAERVAEELLNEERGKRELSRIDRQVEEQRQAGFRRVQGLYDESQELKAAKEKEAEEYEAHCDVINGIIAKTRQRVATKTKEKRLERIEYLRLLGLSSLPKEKTRKQKQMRGLFERAAAERKEAEERRWDDDENYQKRLLEQRMERHEEYLKAHAAEVDELETRKKVLMLTRFRNAEEEVQSIQAAKDAKDEEEKHRIFVLLEQMKIPKYDAYSKKDAEDALKATMERYSEYDKKYLKYAEEATQKCAEMGWNPIGLDRIIKKYREEVMGETTTPRPPNVIDKSTKHFHRTFTIAKKISK